jgi:hypothetical protein
MISYETNPKWLYKPIEVENLKEIQREIIPIIYKKIPNFFTAEPQFIHIMRDEIEPFAPLYTEFIKKFGIIEQWHWCAIITTNLGIDFDIHVDSTDWETRCYGLNLPMVNCEGTHTVWYDAEIESPFFDENDFRSVARVQKANTIATEIGRWDMSKPAWINTSIPHRPESTHRRPRAIISARFDPELHEMLYI